MREALRAAKSPLNCEPRRPIARTHFPELFAMDEDKRTRVFYAIGLKILFKTRDPQAKQSKVPESFDGNIYSLYCLKTNLGGYRYFLSPRKKGQDALGQLNFLGKGGQGIVVPGYELTKNAAGEWTLDPEAPPTVAIKISKPVGPDLLQKKHARRQQELDIAKFAYGDSIAVFPEPFHRKCEKEIVEGKIHKTLSYYKIYLAMAYLPGMSGREFCSHYSDALHYTQMAPHLSAEEKNKYLLKIFLESLNYCLSLIDKIVVAHKNNICLIDVKPENMIFNNGEVTLIDFGQSEINAENKKMPDYRGTAPFAPPETLEEGAHFSKNADKYPLGLTLYHVLGGDERKFMHLKFHDSKGQINPLTRALSHHGPKRVRNRYLAEIPIKPEVKNAMKNIVRGLLSVEPKQRPELAEVKAVFEAAKQEAEKTLQLLEKEIEEKCFQELGFLYHGLYGNKDELRNLTVSEKLSDRLNFFCWQVNHKNFEFLDMDFQERILKQLYTLLRIAPSDSRADNIQMINEKVKEHNETQPFITRWQFHRIHESYAKYKERSFMGLRWLAQSQASAKAIRAANVAGSPAERYKALIYDYLSPAKSTPFCAFFRTRKKNAERALGQSIMSINRIVSPAA